MTTTFRRSVMAGAIASVLFGAAGAASAQVRYDFAAFSSFDFSGETFSGGFSVVLPDVVTADTTVPVASLLSCTVAAVPAAPAACGDQWFRFDVSPGRTTIGFGVQTEANPNSHIYYYFDGGAFSTLGTHESVIFGSDQAGRLTVSAVPEPGQWALFALGLAAVGASVRRTRRTPA